MMPAVPEYDYSDRAFVQLQGLVRRHCGIELPAEKKNIVYGRLTRRLRMLGLGSFEEYCRILEDGHEEELEQFINALTTNLTSFFRESYHFDYLRDTVLPVVGQRNARSRRLRIWSAGCSTGEEPYSIAMTLLESIPHIEKWDIKILATDLDTSVLEQARCGVYSREKVDALPEKLLKACFHRGTGSRHGLVRVAPAVRKLVSFRQHNLVGAWPIKGPFDIIFCRNVVIYFDKPTQQRLFERYAGILAPEGYLFIGHSESLFRVSERFRLMGRTIYRRER